MSANIIHAIYAMDSVSGITFATLGCKLNQAETEQLACQFGAAGYKIADETAADICVLNTCTVTHVADRKSRHLIRLFRKRNPHVFIIATGCYAERAPEELIRAGADMVVGNKRKSEIVEMLNKKLSRPMLPNSLQKNEEDSLSRVRSFVKIQDGCQSGCAYCVVPSVRGTEFCLAVEEIVKTVKTRYIAGHKEVILTGTKVGSYRHDGIDLGGLVKRILDDTSVERIHVSSLQPQEISTELLTLWRNPRLIRHFHLVLQSGCDSILKRMNRRYTTADYKMVLDTIRKFIPDVAITTDIIVGFPGESGDEFEESYRFCKEIGFAAMHIFVYSPRPETLAATMRGQVSSIIKKERSLRMLELARGSAELFESRFLGHEMIVLWENEVNPGSGVYSGLTENYMRVFTRNEKSLNNRVTRVRLVKKHKEGFWGEIIG